MSTIIEPEQGRVVVEFSEGLPTVIKDHDSLTFGTVITRNKEDKHKDYLVGRIAYWRRYKDDARIDKNHAFIDIEDIMGSSYADTASPDG